MAGESTLHSAEKQWHQLFVQTLNNLCLHGRDKVLRKIEKKKIYNSMTPGKTALCDQKREWKVRFEGKLLA